jgi:hypothetical protein
VASFDKAIPPGGEGKITLSVRTKGYQEEHHWSARVNTNDPIKDLFYLELKAFVNVPIFISTRHVYLQTEEGRKASRRVEIRAGLDRPLTLQPEQFDLKEKVTYKIHEIEKGRRFSILFTIIPGPPGDYSGFLKLKTNYPEETVVTIQIRGRSVKKGKVSN